MGGICYRFTPEPCSSIKLRDLIERGKYLFAISSLQWEIHEERQILRKTIEEIVDDASSTCIHYCVRGGAVNVLRTISKLYTLEEHDQLINLVCVQNNYGNTCLHSGYLEIMRLNAQLGNDGDQRLIRTKIRSIINALSEVIGWFHGQEDMKSLSSILYLSKDDEDMRRYFAEVGVLPSTTTAPIHDGIMEAEVIHDEESVFYGDDSTKSPTCPLY